MGEERALGELLATGRTSASEWFSVWRSVLSWPWPWQWQ
jgi:hypothetical protein